MHRLEQHLHALLLDQLPEVDDGRLVAGEERGEPLGVALVGQALLGVARVRRIARAPRRAAPRAPRRASCEARTRRRRRPAAPRCTRSTWPTTSSSTSRMCCEPTNVASACASASRPQRSSSGRPRIEYSSSEPCALTRNGAPVAAPTGAAQQHVVREDEVGRAAARAARPRSPRRTRAAPRR